MRHFSLITGTTIYALAHNTADCTQLVHKLQYTALKLLKKNIHIRKAIEKAIEYQDSW